MELRDAFPDAHMVGCSTVGEILNTHITDDSIVAPTASLDEAPIVMPRKEFNSLI